MLPVFFLLITSIWIPAGESYEEIPIKYHPIEQCGGYHAQKQLILGCYSDSSEAIQQIELNPDYVFDPTYLGYNVWTHEVLHAWGYSHAEMEQLFVNELPVHEIPAERIGSVSVGGHIFESRN